MEFRKCLGTPTRKGCGENKPISAFPASAKTVNGKYTPKSMCTECDLRSRRDAYAKENSKSIGNDVLSCFINKRWV